MLFKVCISIKNYKFTENFEIWFGSKYFSVWCGCGIFFWLHVNSCCVEKRVNNRQTLTFVYSIVSNTYFESYLSLSNFFSSIERFYKKILKNNVNEATHLLIYSVLSTINTCLASIYQDFILMVGI